VKKVLTLRNLQLIRKFSLSQEGHPNTHLTQRKLARKLHISRASIYRAHRFLGMKCFTKVPVHELNPQQKLQRLEKSRILLRHYSKERISRMVFTDEKMFELNAPRNSQNDRVYGVGKKSNISHDRLNVSQQKKSLKVMVSAGISVAGKTRLHVVPPGVKVNAVFYQDLLRNRLLPDCRLLYPDGDWIFQQDSAPAHTARATRDLLRQETPSYLTPEEWPASSPDCNPLDYRIWELLEQKCFEGRSSFPTIAALTKRLKKVWREFDQDIVKDCILSRKNGFRARLCAVVRRGGGQIEDQFRKI
jgi:hypothetical protein